MHRQENNDALIKFSRDIKKMKVLLEELMTISCEALHENSAIDKNHGNSMINQDDLETQNKTIVFGKKLEQFYSLSDSVQMSLKQAKEQLMVTHFYVANMPTPANVTNKDSYQAYVDTVKCQINDAKQVHNIFKDLSNKLKFPSYSTDIFNEEDSSKTSKGIVGLGQLQNQQNSSLLSQNSQNGTPLKNDKNENYQRELNLTPAVTVEAFDYGAILVMEDKMKKEKES